VRDLIKLGKAGKQKSGVLTKLRTENKKTAVVPLCNGGPRRSQNID
jgi:hypothetical protein